MSNGGWAVHNEGVSECVGFNVPLDTQQVISETSLSRQSTALVLTTKKQSNTTLHTPGTQK